MGKEYIHLKTYEIIAKMSNAIFYHLRVIWHCLEALTIFLLNELSCNEIN